VQHREDAVEHQPMVRGRMPRLGFPARQQRVQPPALSVYDGRSCHTARLQQGENRP
jgi:hypothetical protein